MESRFETEVRVLQKLRHPGVAALKDIFKDTLNYYLILELYSGGTLRDYILEQRKIAEPWAKNLFKQMVIILKYIHSQGICHRDIKCENILLDRSRLELKFIDFGFSQLRDGEAGLTTTACGSMSYMSPETVELNPHYDPFRSDIWSLGVCLYMMVHGNLPWTQTNARLQIEQIMKGDYFVSGEVSADCADLIHRMMEVDPRKRIPIDGVLEHAWLADVSDHEMDFLNRFKASSMESSAVDEFFSGADTPLMGAISKNHGHTLLACAGRSQMKITRAASRFKHVGMLLTRQSST